MAPILDVDNSANWVHIYGTTLHAAVSSTVPPIYGSISIHSIPGVVYERVLAVGSNSTYLKPKWKLGFWLSGLVQIPTIGLAEIASFPIPIGLSLVILPNLHSEFKLRARIPHWHRNLSLDIWKYVGSIEESPGFGTGDPANINLSFP